MQWIWVIWALSLNYVILWIMIPRTSTKQMPSWCPIDPLKILSLWSTKSTCTCRTNWRHNPLFLGQWDRERGWRTEVHHVDPQPPVCGCWNLLEIFCIHATGGSGHAHQARLMFVNSSRTDSPPLSLK
jgi:hypothetical protein